MNCAKLLLFISVVGVIRSAQLPPDIGRCHITDPNLNDCLGKNVEIAIKKFKDGAPKLGIPPFEPLKIPKMIIGQGTGPVNVVQNFKNIDLFGLTGSTITKYIAKLNEDKIYTESLTPRLELLGDYEMNGRLMVIPVRGHGKCNITLVNSRLTHELIGEKHTKKGKSFFRLTDYKVTIVPERVYYYFENLIAGDDRLSREINTVLNDNWDTVYKDVQSGYEASFGAIFLSLANSLFGRVAYDDIFLS